MWLRKTTLEKQVKEYGRDLDTLSAFIKTVGKDKIEDISLDDIKRFYKEVVELQNSSYVREDTMKAVRKFFREHRGLNILKADTIFNDPLKSVVESDIIKTMQKPVKKKVGRPPNLEMIKKVKVLREQGKLTYRQIGKAIGKDARQAYMWYNASLSL